MASFYQTLPDPTMDPALEPTSVEETAHITLDPMLWYYKNYPRFANDAPDPEDVATIEAQYELQQFRLKKENDRCTASAPITKPTGPAAEEARLMLAAMMANYLSTISAPKSEKMTAYGATLTVIMAKYLSTISAPKSEKMKSSVAAGVAAEAQYESPIQAPIQTPTNEGMHNIALYVQKLKRKEERAKQRKDRGN